MFLATTTTSLAAVPGPPESVVSNPAPVLPATNTVGQVVTSGSTATVVAFMALVLAMAALALALFLRFRKQPQGGSADGSCTDELMRTRLATYLTTGSMIFIAALACLVLLAAGVNALLPPVTTERTTLFFDIVRFVLTALLPVVAGWVGTVLAFYYGRANFEAANQSVREMAKIVSSKDKLASTPVRVLGKTPSEITLHKLNTTDPAVAKQTALNVIRDAFLDPKTTKPYERLPVVFSNECPYLVLHRSFLTDFLLTQKSATPPKDAADCTLEELFKALDWQPERSFVSVGPNATAADAKAEMEKDKRCADVFSTQDGTPASTVVRWITNVDLLKAAEV